MRKILKSATVAPTAKFFSQGVQVGATIYVSGQVAMDIEGNVVGKGDMRIQTRQVLENIKAVLAESGAIIDDVVKVTMFITDMSSADQAREVRMEYFKKNPPASTGVEVRGLAHPDLLIEIEAIAVIGTG
ncbi:MAG: RidA family protein [Planctomycetota bacterium]|nr:RidA family protein [Planctomycetota bacterium]